MLCFIAMQREIQNYLGKKKKKVSVFQMVGAVLQLWHCMGILQGGCQWKWDKLMQEVYEGDVSLHLQEWQSAVRFCSLPRHN